VLVLDFNDGSIVTTGTDTVSGTSTLIGNGWYRVTLSATASGTGVTRFQMRLFNDAGSNDFTGDGVSGTYFWQADLVASSVATSPIVTTAGTASRVADAVTLTGVSSLIGQAESTIFVEAQPNGLLGTVSRSILNLSDGSADNQITLLFTGLASNTIRALLVESVSDDVDFRQVVSNTNVFKLAFAVKSTDSAFYFNGSTTNELADNAFSFPTTISRVAIGSGATGTATFNGWIRSVALFPTRLSNAQLVTLTT
jgi:hypothetical protein